jgi:RNA polymerase sigma-70 factor (ECF subfamily)
MDDAELVREVLQGNFAASDELVRRYTARVAACCRAYVPWPHDVEDLVQETFLRVFVGLLDLREPEKLGPWILTIARNLCREWRRDLNNPVRPLEATPPQFTAIEDDDDEIAVLECLSVCIRRLPVRLREVIELYYGGSRMTYDELADHLGVSFGAVNQRLTMARRLLRDCLNGSGIHR